MNEEITKELAERLMKIKGECRGIHLKNDAEYILRKKGKKGLEKVEKELEALGFPIKYKKVKNLEFYPTGLRAVSLLAIKKVFNWSDGEIKEMCKFAAGVSFVVKLYLKYFYSVPKLLGKASKMWDEYWTTGRVIVKEHNDKEGYVILRIENFDLHPIYCRCVEGYFEGLAKMATRGEPRCQETECSFKGEEGHEFLIKY